MISMEEGKGGEGKKTDREECMWESEEGEKRG